MGLDPVTLDEPLEKRSVHPSIGPIVDILGNGVVPQAGVAQARTQTPVLTPDGLSIEQQGQPVGVAQTGGFIVVGQVGEGLGHALEAEAVELVECRMGEQGRDSLSVVVAGAADVGVGDGREFVAVLIGARAADRLTIEPVIEDGLDRAVAPGADVQRPLTSRFETG
jgi:hypothetical protein